jgi:hypothetical protein
MLWSLYSRGTNLWHLLDTGLGEPYDRLGKRGDEKIPDSTGSRSLTLRQSISQPVATPTSLVICLYPEERNTWAVVSDGLQPVMQATSRHLSFQAAAAKLAIGGSAPL